MRGTAHEVVVLHHECAVTKQMRQDRLACKVKNADNRFGIYYQGHMEYSNTDDSMEIESNWLI